MASSASSEFASFISTNIPQLPSAPRVSPEVVLKDTILAGPPPPPVLPAEPPSPPRKWLQAWRLHSAPVFNQPKAPLRANQQGSPW